MGGWAGPGAVVVLLLCWTVSDLGRVLRALPVVTFSVSFASQLACELAVYVHRSGTVQHRSKVVRYCRHSRTHCSPKVLRVENARQEVAALITDEDEVVRVGAVRAIGRRSWASCACLCIV